MIKQKLRLGDLLIEKGIITEENLINALKLQKESDFSKKLGEILIQEGYTTYKEIARELSSQLKIKFIDIYAHTLNFKLINRYPIAILKNAEAIPLKEGEEYIHVATSNPLAYDALEALENINLSKPVKLYLALDEDVRQIFQRISIIQSTSSIAKEVKQEISSDNYKSNDQDESAVMRLINLILKDAVLRNASDVHIEPDARNVSVRCRVDGVLEEIFVFDLQIYNAIASRIKILGNLDISERRKAQDGRFSMNINQGKYDFRLSTTPTYFGESIVMRILDQQKILLKLVDLGLENKNLEVFEDLIASPYGIILITGPTGSGKTTTLYAALNEIKSMRNKVLTIEDPIEYQLPLVQQVQVNDKIGFSFIAALKSFLRQDPDVIMVGEIRDMETLNAAAQASLTGHLVFSTLHTNDAPSAISRMVQMGLEPYLIADSLLAIVAQRLVRKNCLHCRHVYKPHAKILEKVSKYIPKDAVFYKGRGCNKCNKTGYSGRVMIVEILKLNDEISKMISQNKNKFEIAKVAQESGIFTPMVFDGVSKALKGIIPLEEVIRVTKGH
ncbi:MAG: ATPase, T2SS/T4P/T4SS family [Campylobacterota bacterium]|nr:ATPase, T2SS/T4P/T4SS family [Campylobacterota bacterium]